MNLPRKSEARRVLHFFACQPPAELLQALSSPLRASVHLAPLSRRLVLMSRSRDRRRSRSILQPPAAPSGPLGNGARALLIEPAASATSGDGISRKRGWLVGPDSSVVTTAASRPRPTPISREKS